MLLEKALKRRLWGLSIASALCGLAGISFGFLYQLPLMDPVFQVLWEPFLGSGSAAPKVHDLISFMLGFSGAYVLGWTVLTQALIWIPLKKGETWAWWAILAGILSCFIIDESFSIYFGVTINAIGNLALFAWMIVALLFLRPKK